MGILAILATLFFTATKSSIERAEKPACMANLKNLHMALTTYLSDNGKWPQIPGGIALDSPAEDAWWRTTLAPYGMTEKSWRCPTLFRTAREKMQEDGLKENHYSVSLFDEYPATPYRWPKMPWAMEVGNNHGCGLLVIMMDGAVLTGEEFERMIRR